jgi:hypothetical protein
MLLDFVVWLYVVIADGFFIEPNQPAAIGAIIVLFAIGVGVVLTFLHLKDIGFFGSLLRKIFRDRSSTRRIAENTGEEIISPFSIAYQSFKDKVCLKIDFKD